MARKIKLRSVSNSATSDVAFARCLTTIILSINDNAADDCYARFTTWASAADPFLRTHGLLKVAGPLFNKFCMKKKDNAAGAGHPLTESEVVKLGQAILANDEALVQDTGISKQVYTLIKQCRTNMITASESSFNAIAKNIGILRSAELNQIWMQDVEVPKDATGPAMASVAKKIRVLTTKITGDASKPMINPNTFVTYTTMRRNLGVKQSDASLKHIATWNNVPDSTIEEYSRLVKIVNAATKREAAALCLATKRLLVPASELKAALDKKGIPNLIPTTYSGLQFNEKMQAFNANGAQLQAVPYGAIQMNSKYDHATDSEYIFKGTDHNKRYSTFNMSSMNKQRKFSKVGAFLDNESQNRNKWLPDLNNRTSPNRVMAAMVELLYATAARIGAAGNATKGEATYGLSTLLVKHVQVQPTRVIFDYEGKKKASQYAVYPLKTALEKRVAAVIAECIKDKSPEEHVFTERKILRSGGYGREQKITAADVRIYLKTLGVDLTPHNFRHIAGTKIMRKVIASSPFKKGAKQAEVNTWFTTQLLEAGEVLHHTTGGAAITASTAIANYVDPTLMKEFFDGLSLRAPNAVLKAFKTGEKY